MYNAQKLLFQHCLFDSMGVITPFKEAEDITQIVLNRNDVAGAAKTKLGYDNIQQVRDVVSEGIILSRAGEKSNPKFGEYMKIWDIAGEYVYDNGIHDMPLMDGIEEVLKAIDEAEGILSQYSSSSLDYMVSSMKVVGMEKTFKALYSAYDSAVQDKQSSKSYKEIAKREKVNPSAMCFTTDNEGEAKAAAEAGYGTVFLLNSKYDLGRSDTGYVVIHDIRDLLKYIFTDDYTEKVKVPIEAAE